MSRRVLLPAGSLAGTAFGHNRRLFTEETAGCAPAEQVGLRCPTTPNHRLAERRAEDSAALPRRSIVSPSRRLLGKRWFFVPLALVLGAHPDALWACAACYGQSDSPMAQGMNWGILSLLAVVVFVLGGVAGFFVYLARRASDLHRPT